MTYLTLTAVLLLLATPAAAQTPAPGIEVSQPWARATAGAGRSAAVYFTLRDHGAADRLTGASTPVAGMAMLHESTESNGVAHMRMLNAIELLPEHDTVLRPGGLHLMLTGLNGPLRQGQTFSLTLTFAHAAPVTLTVPVLAPGAAGP